MNQGDTNLSNNFLKNENLHNDGFLDWGGGGGGIVEVLYDPGESPESEVFDLDQSEVVPGDRLFSGESSSAVPGVYMEIGRFFRSGVRFRVRGPSSRVSSSEKSVDPSSCWRLQSIFTFSNIVFCRFKACSN